MTTTTELNPNPRHSVAAKVRTEDGTSIGYVVRKASTFEARRRNGQTGIDIRRVGPGFRSIEAAAAWIEKGDR